MAKSKQSKAENKSDSESTTPVSKPSLYQTLHDIPIKNAQIEQINKLKDENKTLRDAINERRKSTRGPSAAGRVQGLQVLKNTLGTQFGKDGLYNDNSFNN